MNRSILIRTLLTLAVGFCALASSPGPADAAQQWPICDDVTTNSTAPAPDPGPDPGPGGDDPCCTAPCSDACKDFAAKCDAGCNNIDPDCCTAPCTVACQDPAAKCQNGCSDIDPDCCTNPCSSACSELDAKCQLCGNEVVRCEAGCTSDLGLKSLLPAPSWMNGDGAQPAALDDTPGAIEVAGCPSACADELDPNDLLIYQACMAFWEALIPFPDGLAPCDYCSKVPWHLRQLCQQVCGSTPLGCLNLKMVLGDLVCCDVVQSTQLPYEACWDFDRNKLCIESIAGCNNWQRRCEECCRAHGRSIGGPCYQNCLYQRALNPDSPCFFHQ